jgi:CPA2 family monovalent cation:H+ antiporter-2
VVVALKVASTTVALLPLRVGWRRAVATGLLLGQVGEFSFVLLTVGQDAGLGPAGFGPDGEQVFLSTTVLLMVLTPALAWSADRIATSDSPREGQAAIPPRRTARRRQPAGRTAAAMS